MRITCPKCSSDFVVPPSQLGESDVTSGCPFCGNEYRAVLRVGEEEPQIYFGSASSRPKRICIQCSREFESNDQDVIPICSNCKEHRKDELEVPVKTAWKLVKAGRVITLYSEEEVKDWIAQNAILPDDELIDPTGSRRTAKRYTNFSNAFRAQMQKPKSKTKAVITLSPKYYVSRTIPPLLFLLFSAPVLWTLFRIITFKPVGPLFNKDVAQFVTKLASHPTTTSGATSDLFKSALQSMAKDQPEGYEEAVQLLEQAAQIDRTSCPVLGTLAEAYALSSDAATDSRFRLAATSLGNLVTQVCPNEIEGYVAKIRAALLASDFVSAKEDMTTALSVSPAFPRLLLARQAYLIASAKSSNELDEAQQAARAALAQDSTLLEAYDFLGQAHLKKLEPLEARKAFENRLQQSSDDPKALFRMGELEQNAGNIKMAKEWFQQSLRQSPKMASARLALALLQLKDKNEKESAFRHLQEVTTRYRRYAGNDELFRAQLELAKLLSTMGKQSEALDALQKLPMEYGNSAEAVLTKARVLAASDRVEDAISQLKEAANNLPSNDQIRFEIGRLHQAKDRVDDAVKAFREAIKINARGLSPYLYLARILIQNHREGEALDVSNTMVSRAEILEETAPIDLPWKIFIQAGEKLTAAQSDQPLSHAFLGFVELKMGLDNEDEVAIRKSIKSFQKMKGNTQSADNALYFLGRAYFALDELGRSKSQFEEMARNNTINLGARYWLGIIHLKEKQYSMAQMELGKVVTDTDWGYFALNALGDVFIAQDKSEEAAQHWRASLKARENFVSPFRSLLALKSN